MIDKRIRAGRQPAERQANFLFCGQLNMAHIGFDHRQRVPLDQSAQIRRAAVIGGNLGRDISQVGGQVACGVKAREQECS